MVPILERQTRSSCVNKDQRYYKLIMMRCQPDNACSMLLAPTVIQWNTIIAFVLGLLYLHNGIIYRITRLASRAWDANYGISGGPVHDREYEHARKRS